MYASPRTPRADRAVTGLRATADVPSARPTRLAASLRAALTARTAAGAVTRTRTALTARAAARTPTLLRLTAALLGATALLAPPAAAHAAAHAMGLPMPVPYPRSAAEGSLTVKYDDGSGSPRTYDVACDGVRTMQRDMNACRRLEQLDGPLGAVQPGQMCSMIYGGPQTAEVSGVWRGRTVSETYRRTNGCEVARWNRMVPALPNPANPAPAPAAAGHADLTTPPGSARPAEFTVPGDGATSSETRPDFFTVPHTASTQNRAPHTT